MKTYDKIISSAPEGLFYYSTLRDKSNIILICDDHGFPNAFSILKTNQNAKIIYVSNNPVFNFTNEDSVIEYSESIPKLKPENTSVFISGCENFCETAKKLYPNARINVTRANDILGKKNAEYNIKVTYRNNEFSFKIADNETLLSAFERNNIPANAKCKIGECGYCRCRLISGKTETVLCCDIDSRRQSDIDYGYIHPCRTLAKSDLTLAL